LNRGMRAGCVVGLLVISGGEVISCGSADTSNLFSAASVSSSNTEGGSADGVNHAGSVGVAGTEAGGAAMHSGGSPGTGHGGAASGGSAPGTSGASNAGSSGSVAQGGTNGSAGHAGMTGTGGVGASAGMLGGAGDGVGGNAGSGGSLAGAGGNGGFAGSAGAAAGTGGTGGTGGSGPASCTNNAVCSPSEYCAKVDCAAQTVGTCTSKPSAMDCVNTVAAPVCGCDGVTYHDACLLHANRQNSLAEQPAGGVCSKAAAGTVTCSAFDTMSCTQKNGVCSGRDDTCSGLGNPSGVGVCWVIPTTCPAADPKLMVGCTGGGSCRSECAVLKAGVRYALSDSCP